MLKTVPVFFKNNFEDPSVLKELNTIFANKRGYDFKMPKKNEPVLLIVSGGLDSIMLWFHLMSVYGLVVYPIHFNSPLFNKNNIPGETVAIKFFYNYFKKIFPNLVRPIKFLPIDLHFSLTKNVRILENNWRIVANNILHDKSNGKKATYLLDYPTRFARYLLSAYEYGLLLQSQNIPAATIFLGVVPSDGTFGREATLTVLRSLNMYLCLVLGDWKWQITGPIEKKHHFYFPKKRSIQSGFKSNIPLERTWSCARPFPLHCGLCNACRYRQLSFLDAGVKDKTMYLIPPHIKKFLKLILGRSPNNPQIHHLIKLKNGNRKKDTHLIKKTINTISLADNVDFFQSDLNMFVRNEETEEILKLNPVGSQIFKLLASNKSISFQKIIEKMNKSYPNISEKQLLIDTEKYLIHLEKRSLVKLL